MPASSVVRAAVGLGDPSAGGKPGGSPVDQHRAARRDGQRRWSFLVSHKWPPCCPVLVLTTLYRLLFCCCLSGAFNPVECPSCGREMPPRQVPTIMPCTVPARVHQTLRLPLAHSAQSAVLVGFPLGLLPSGAPCMCTMTCLMSHDDHDTMTPFHHDL